jgi:hypothetical protein
VQPVKWSPDGLQAKKKKKKKGGVKKRLSCTLSPSVTNALGDSGGTLQGKCSLLLWQESPDVIGSQAEQSAPKNARSEPFHSALWENGAK